MSMRSGDTMRLTYTNGFETLPPGPGHWVQVGNTWRPATLEEIRAATDPAPCRCGHVCAACGRALACCEPYERHVAPGGGVVWVCLPCHKSWSGAIRHR